MPDPFVELTIARDLQHAFLIKATLEEAGIRVFVQNESLQSVLGEVPLGPATAPSVLVPREEVGRAARILAELRPDSGAQPDGSDTS